jgi:hypothetical protein
MGLRMRLMVVVIGRGMKQIDADGRRYWFGLPPSERGKPVGDDMKVRVVL